MDNRVERTCVQIDVHNCNENYRAWFDYVEYYIDGDDDNHGDTMWIMQLMLN